VFAPPHNLQSLLALERHLSPNTSRANTLARLSG